MGRRASDASGGIVPGDGEGARPGEYRLPGADLVSHAILWALLLLGVLAAAYVVMGTLDQSGLVAVDRDIMWKRLAAWLVPAAAAMALLRTLGLARQVDRLIPLPMALFLGICIFAWVLVAPVAGVLLLLDWAGVRALGAAPAALLLCQALGSWLALYVDHKSPPAGARDPAADGAQTPGESHVAQAP